MKISLQELRAFEDFIQRLEDRTERKYIYPKGHPDEGWPRTWGYYAEHPHFLMVMGFDEYVAFKNKRQFKEQWFANDVEDTRGERYQEQPCTASPELSRKGSQT